MTRRILALIAAVGMVVGAVMIRRGMDEQEERTRSPLRVVCAPALRAACEDLASRLEDEHVELRIEAPGATADRLTALTRGDTSDVDLWFTIGPWPSILADRRQRAGASQLLDAGEPVGRTQLTVLGWTERLTAMQAACGGAPTWACVGELASKQRWVDAGGRPEWGPVKLGFDDPAAGDAGLQVLAAVVRSYAGRADVSSNDLDADDRFRSIMGALARARRADVTIERMAAQGPAILDLYAGPRSVADGIFRASARRQQLSLRAPEPSAVAEVHVGHTNGDRRERAMAVAKSAQLRDALDGVGWTLDAPASPQLDPGVLDYLRSVWQEVSR